MQYEFGSGVAWGIPTIGVNGAAVSAPTPVPFGVMQDISVDFAYSSKELYGLSQFPVAVGRGTAKVTGKAKVGRFQASLFNLLFGETPADGEVNAVRNESATVTGNTVTVANNATFQTDLGVIYGANGVPLTRGAVAANGIYAAPGNGVYNFGAGDNNAAVKISYTYTKNAAPGKVITLNNQLLGTSIFFKLVLQQSFQGKILCLTLNRCISTKLGIATKLEDFSIPEIDFSAMVDDSDVLGTISLAEP
jgi:hypothetical protein